MRGGGSWSMIDAFALCCGFLCSSIVRSYSKSWALGVFKLVAIIELLYYNLQNTFEME